MADNIELDAGTGGATIAADDVGGVHYQVVKIDVGGDGAAAPLSTSNPMPVSDSGGSLTVDNAGLTELAAAINSNQVDVNIAASAATVAVSNAGLTELAAAINASSQVDVNVAAGTVAVTHAALTELGAAIDTELQVDIVGALPAGTNAIGKLAANSGVDIGDVDITSIAAGDNNIGNVDIASIAAGDNNIGNVDVASLPASTNTLEVVGDVAHDAAAAGNPVQTGGYATNNIEGITQVAAADLTRTVHDLNGVQVVRPHTTLEEIVSARTSNTDGASTSLIAAGGSGVHTYITTVAIWNSSATDGFVDLRDGTGGAVLFTLPAPQTGGSVVTFPVPLKFGDNTAVAFDASGAITTIYISAVGFQAQG